MQDGGQDNAMAEIALALAMAFFTIMVLAMISMGIPPEAAAPAADAAASGVALAEATDEAADAPPSRAGRRLIVHHGGRYYDADALTPVVDPGALDGPLTLAVDPALPTAEALALRRRLGAADVIVSTLDERWLNRLKEMDP